jgi:PqqD family protein of HPr-rel-A system
VAVQGLESTPVENGVIMFHAKSGKFVMLNRSAALVWAELGTPKTEEELAQKLSASFTEVTPSTARQDVKDVLEQLRQLELVSPV